jgi:hypothetical protein
MPALDRELATFKTALPNLMIDQGKFALVSGDEVLGTFDTYADALKAGYEKLGVRPFLVKKIAADENIAYFTRDLGMKCPA